MNGRGYPDTLGAERRPADARRRTRRLQYQPISSLVRCNAGDRVLLRMANLGYQNHAMTVGQPRPHASSPRTRACCAAATARRTRISTRPDHQHASRSARARAVDVDLHGPRHQPTGEYLLYDRTYDPYLRSNGGGIRGYGRDGDRQIT